MKRCFSRKPTISVKPRNEAKRRAKGLRVDYMKRCFSRKPTSAFKSKKTMLRPQNP